MTLETKENGIRLKELKIFGLHGTHNVSLSFNDPFTVFFAENGAGKTTTLFILQCILTGKFSKITRFNFDRLSIEIFGRKFDISHSDFSEVPSNRFLFKVKEQSGLSMVEISNLANLAQAMPIEELSSMAEFQHLRRVMRMPTHILARRLSSSFLMAEEHSDSSMALDLESPIQNLRKLVNTQIDAEILYLPTYRRVEQGIDQIFEEDSRSERYEKRKITGIQFGMGDVQKDIERLSEQVQRHGFSIYHRVSAQLLSQLVNNKNLTKSKIQEVLQSEEIPIILDRLDPFITKKDIISVKTSIKSGEVLDNKELLFFLSKLLENYNEIRLVEQAIQGFVEKCNQYIRGKEFRYDTKTADVSLVSKRSNRPMELDNLSSGEKQLVGVMSKMYLGEKSSYFVIFDEPELSLSVEWQKKILVDIANSNTCSLLVAATHSPFIIENELDEFAGVIGVQYVD